MKKMRPASLIFQNQESQASGKDKSRQDDDLNRMKGERHGAIPLLVQRILFKMRSMRILKAWYHFLAFGAGVVAVADSRRQFPDDRGDGF
ncbi:MAG: hypothetical protein ACOX6W_10880 [Lentisphaeria bacterium]